MTEIKNHERAHSLVNLVMDAPWYARYALVAVLVGGPLVGGFGGLTSFLTVPQRLSAMERQVARSDSLRVAESVRTRNESGYLRGEVNAIRIQISYFVCLDERIDDPGRRSTCESIRAQVQAILDAQAR